MSQPLSPYQKKLFVFLSMATFFEGYDLMVISQVLPNLRQDMDLNRAEVGIMLTVINFGAMIAFILVRQADRWGRRKLLTITIAGYTLCTFATGLSGNVFVFAGLQFLARIFLLAENAVSFVIAAEEFPPEKRGTVIGIISGFSALGAIICAGITPLLLESDMGWRTVYFVGIIPLIVLAIARRGLKETQRFQTYRDSDMQALPLTYIFKTPYKKQLLQLSLIWFLAYIGAQNAVTFWKDFAVNERGWTDAMVGKAIPLAAIAAMPLVFYAGKITDWLGRRPGSAIIFGLGAVGIFLSYTLHSEAALTAALILGIFAASAFFPVVSAYTTELFPTELRGAAYAWANNIFGRIAYVLSPLLIGALADIESGGARIGFGPIVAATAVFPILTFICIWVMLPETSNRELEDILAHK